MVSWAKRMVLAVFGPLYFLKSLLFYKIQFTPVKSPTTRFKAKYQLLHNQLTELLIENVPLVSLDIGNMMTKVLVFIPEKRSPDQDVLKINPTEPGLLKTCGFSLPNLSGSFQFYMFNSNKFYRVIDFLKKYQFPHTSQKTLRCTGTGVPFFKQHLLDGLDNLARVEFHDEVVSLHRGLVFLTYLKRKKERELFNFKSVDEESYNKCNLPKIYFNKQFYVQAPFNYNTVFPCLMVQIGSRVQYIECTLDSATRIDSSPIGGGTFYSVQKMLTEFTDFDVVTKKVERGLSQNIDMTVGDVYGGDYKAVGLDADLLASCFGKAKTRIQQKQPPTTCDKARATLQMICINIAHIAVLHTRVNKFKRIVFTGLFAAEINAQAILNWTVNYYSGGTIEAIFVQHSGVLGSLGSVLGSEVLYEEGDDQIGEDIVQAVQQINNVSFSNSDDERRFQE